MLVRNIAHENARKAFAAIQDVKDHHPDAFIHQCGLLQTLAFYLAKKKNHHCLLLEHLLEYIGPEYLPDGDRLNGYRRLIGKKDTELMLCTAKIRQYLLWLKRYAEAMLDDKKHDKKCGEDGEDRDRDSRRPENLSA